MVVRLKRALSALVCMTCGTPLESNGQPQPSLWTPDEIRGGIGGGVSALYCEAQNPELTDAVKCLESPKSPQWQRAVVSGYFGGPQSVEKQGRSGSYGWT